MKCCFCNRDYPVLAKAHVIPRSFFKLLRGDGHYSVLFRASQKAITQQYKQAGIYDREILCEECERRFSPCDAHGFAVFTGVFKNQVLYLDSNGIPCAFLLPNVNYRLLKLFVLSVLWRASTSKLEFFKRVELGSHEKRIKSIILDGAVDAAGDYDFVCFHQVNQRYPKVILPPWSRKIGGANYVQLYLPDIQILVKVDKRPFVQPFPTITIKPEPPHYLAFLPYEKSTESKFFEGMKRMIRAHQWSKT